VRIPRFKTWLAEQLDQHPDITQVEEYEVNPGLTDLKITTGDQVVYLRVVGTAPPGGDNPAEPEQIVTKHDLVSA